MTERGPIQRSARQPDIIEKPGLRLDFVAREAVRFLGKEGEIKLEARNLLGQDYEEYQDSRATASTSSATRSAAPSASG